MSTEQITAAALALPPEEKAKLAEQLLQSLDDPEQAEVDAAWAVEAERRIAAHDRGEMPAISFEQALRDSKARLR